MPARRHARSTRRRSSDYVKRTWPASRCRARSSSSTSCPATRPARSSSATWPSRPPGAAGPSVARPPSLAWTAWRHWISELDLAGLRLTPGEGRRLALEVPSSRCRSEASATGAAGERAGDARRLAHDRRRLRAAPALRRGLSGPCMRCLKEAEPSVEVDAREVDRPSEGEELQSPYVERGARSTWRLGPRRLRAGGSREGALPRGLRGAVPDLRGRSQRGRSRAPRTRPSPTRAGAKLRELELE